MSRTSVHAPPASETPPSPERHPAPGASMTTHEASRAKKAVESNVKAVENRINFFKREEERIWRDLEEVRRQAATIEEGRARIVEKKLADRAIQQERELLTEQNRAKAVAAKTTSAELRRRNQLTTMREKQTAGQEQRRASQDINRQKRVQDAEARLQNSERAVAVQRAQLEAKLKVNQERAERLGRVRDTHEAERIAAESEVHAVESRLPQLEAEELVCLQRLQNSRIVTQSVLEELQTSLGGQSSVAALLRQKQRGKEHLGAPGSLNGSGICEEGEAELSAAGHSPAKLPQ